jgi:hypothetical protein
VCCVSVEDWLGKELGHTEVVRRAPGTAGGGPQADPSAGGGPQADPSGAGAGTSSDAAPSGQEVVKVTRPGWHADDDRPQLKDRLGLTMLHAFAHYYYPTQ